MGQRPTRKAGLPQSRHQDPKVQRALDAIIERLEILDGLRGDQLDKAVTYRDLSDSGFVVTLGGTGGGPLITNTPGTGTGSGGDGPGVGPAAAPENLTATSGFLSIFLEWDNPSFNLQHIEVWRHSTDVLADAVLVGTTVSPLYVDYVGSLQTYWYWVRAVGTDGTYSAFSNSATATSSLDPSEFENLLTIVAANLDAVLAARIDLIDNPTTGLVDRIGVVEGDVVALESDVTTLQSDVSGINVTLDGNTSSISANASLIETNQTSITTLTNDLLGVEGDVADNTASITSQASRILSLESSVGALDSESGENWEFTSDVEGFTASNATATWDSDGVIVFTPTGADPQLFSPTFTNLSGSLYTQVVMRIRQTTGGASWEGNLYYKTAGGWQTPVALVDPSLALSEWTTLTWDMTDVAAWVNGGITDVRFDLVSDAAGVFEVDWIQIARISTTALSEAIEALDTRVTVNENGVSSNATAITALASTVDDVDGGVLANANAISALTTTVNNNTSGVGTNASAITALEATVNDGTTGVVASANAIDQLQVDVSAVEGTTTAQASSLTQLVARISGSYASIVNTLSEAGEAFGTDYGTFVQTFNDVGGRSGVAGRQDSATNDTKTISKFDGTKLAVEPNAVYEVKFSLYHNRPSDQGTFLVGATSYDSNDVVSSVTLINNGVAAGTSTTPHWLSGYKTVGGNQWLDVTCYILGADVDVSKCPDLRINGSTENGAGYTDFYDGIKVASLSPNVELRILNYNTSPTYGDDTATTLYLTDLQVRRVDSAAENYAALQVQATTTANDVGDLNALYAVQVELNGANDPYVSGFGLASQVIGGTASSAFGIRADQFFIQHPSATSETSVPFAIGVTGDGTAQVGINGNLIVTDTILGDSILAGTIGAEKINVANLSALSANMGTLTSGLIRTAASPAYRVELEAGSAWPIWYGSGTKSAPNGLFYVTDGGDVVVKGLLDAGMIKQSYFTPADGNNSFRIACDYPSAYTAGIYTGKKAHLSPTLTTGHSSSYSAVGSLPGVNIAVTTGRSLGDLKCGYHTDVLTLYSPTHTGGTVEYGRLGTLSENLVLRYFAEMASTNYNIGYWLLIKYQYDSETEQFAFVNHARAVDSSGVTIAGEDLFITRDTAWSTLKIRMGLGCDYYGETYRTQSANLTVATANFGYADLGGITTPTTGSDSSPGTTPIRDPGGRFKYL